MQFPDISVRANGHVYVTYRQFMAQGGQQDAVIITKSTGAKTAAKLADPQIRAQQLFPDLSIEGGPLHLLWWDSRRDGCYSLARPIGNCADRSLVPALDVFATTSTKPQPHVLHEHADE